MYYVGIDTGKEGAVSIVDAKGEVVYCASFWSRSDTDAARAIHLHNIFNFVATFLEGEPYKINIERMGSRDGNSSKANTTIVTEYKYVVFCLVIRNLKYKIINPKDWQEFYGLFGKGRDEIKTKAFEIASKFKGFDKFLTKNKSKNSGLADATCIASYLALQ